MYELASMYDFYSGGGSTWLIVSVVVALAGTVAAAVYFFGPQKRARLSGLMLKISAHINFEHFIIPLILKFLYVFSALFLVIYGLVTIFTSSFIYGLLMMVLGPIVIRIAYELVMMLASIHDGIRETNRLLRSGAQMPRGSVPPQYGRATRAPQQDSRGEEMQPEQPKHYPGGYDPLHRG